MPPTTGTNASSPTGLVTGIKSTESPSGAITYHTKENANAAIALASNEWGKMVAKARAAREAKEAEAAAAAAGAAQKVGGARKNRGRMSRKQKQSRKQNRKQRQSRRR